MADVQISVRLRRKSGNDLFVTLCLQVRGDDLADEIRGSRCFRQWMFWDLYLASYRG